MGSHPLLFTSLRDVVISSFRALKVFTCLTSLPLHCIPKTSQYQLSCGGCLFTQGSSSLLTSSTSSWRVLSIAMHALITYVSMQHLACESYLALLGLSLFQLNSYIDGERGLRCVSHWRLIR